MARPVIGRELAAQRAAVLAAVAAAGRPIPLAMIHMYLSPAEFRWSHQTLRNAAQKLVADGRLIRITDPDQLCAARRQGHRNVQYLVAVPPAVES